MNNKKGESFMSRNAFFIPGLLLISFLSSCSSPKPVVVPHESERLFASEPAVGSSGDSAFLEDEKRDDNISALRKIATKKKFHFEVQFNFVGQTPDYAKIDRLVEDLKRNERNKVQMGSDARNFDSNEVWTVSFEFEGTLKKTELSVPELTKRLDDISKWQFIQIDE